MALPGTKKMHSWLISTETEFDFKSQEYHALFATADATVFQTPIWLSTFYSKMIPSHLLTPVIVTVRDINGVLQMVLPCVRQTISGVRIVQPADLGISDYNCPVVAKDAIDQINQDDDLQSRILAALSPFDVIFFRKQRADKPSIRDVLGGGSVSPSESNSREVSLTAPYSEWAKRELSSNFRSANRRKMRKMMASYSTCDFETVTDPKDIDEALRFIQRHRGDRYKDDVLKEETIFDFYLTLATQHAESGFSQTFIMRVDGKIVSAFFGLNHNGAHCYLLGSFLPGEFDRYSVGVQTINALIENRADQGFHTFDFGLGGESYKDRFGAKEIGIQHVTYASSPLGRLIDLTYRKAKPVHKLLKGLDPRIR